MGTGASQLERSAARGGSNSATAQAGTQSGVGERCAALHGCAGVHAAPTQPDSPVEGREAPEAEADRPSAFPWRAEPSHLLDARDGRDGVARPERRKDRAPRDRDAPVELHQKQHQEGDHEEQLEHVRQNHDHVRQPEEADAASCWWLAHGGGASRAQPVGSLVMRRAQKRRARRPQPRGQCHRQP